MTEANLTHSGLAALVLATIFATAAHAEDPCAAFSWDVSHERTLFSAPAQPLAAAASPGAAPALSPERLYEFQLVEQSKVTFAAAPAKKP